MAKPLSKEQEKLLVVSAIKTTADMIIESSFYIEDCKKSDSAITTGEQMYHDKRLQVAYRLFDDWINEYIKQRKGKS